MVTCYGFSFHVNVIKQINNIFRNTYKVIKLILLGNAETNMDIFDLMLKMFDPKFIIAQIIFSFQLYDQKFYCSDMLQSEHI